MFLWYPSFFQAPLVYFKWALTSYNSGQHVIFGIIQMFLCSPRQNLPSNSINSLWSNSHVVRYHNFFAFAFLEQSLESLEKSIKLNKIKRLSFCMPNTADV